MLLGVLAPPALFGSLCCLYSMLRPPHCLGADSLNTRTQTKASCLLACFFVIQCPRYKRERCPLFFGLLTILLRFYTQLITILPTFISWLLSDASHHRARSSFSIVAPGIIHPSFSFHPQSVKTSIRFNRAQLNHSTTILPPLGHITSGGAPQGGTCRSTLDNTAKAPPRPAGCPRPAQTKVYVDGREQISRLNPTKCSIGDIIVTSRTARLTLV